MDDGYTGRGSESPAGVGGPIRKRGFSFRPVAVSLVLDGDSELMEWEWLGGSSMGWPPMVVIAVERCLLQYGYGALLVKKGSQSWVGWRPGLW